MVWSTWKSWGSSLLPDHELPNFRILRFVNKGKIALIL